MTDVVSKFKILEDIRLKAQHDMEQHMRPIIEQVKEVHKTVAPIGRSLHALLNTVAPVMQSMATVNKSLTEITLPIKPETISADQYIISPPRPPHHSVEDIAEAVCDELAERNKTKPKILEATAEKPAVALPDGARWEEIRLDLKDNRSIDVFYKKELIGNYDYEDLGLARNNTNRKEPGRQSKFLEVLALASMNNGMFKPTTSIVAKSLGVKENNCHQIKRALAKKLQAAFGIQESPFYTYDPVEGYKPRFELRPISLLRNDDEVHRSGGYLNDEATDYTGSH